ncbi:MAG: hypothetical protein LBH60_05605 [Prevotellaceae bacterium]|nr:hypothetical protein [Prevotellaceae bacterium]
MNSMFFHFIIDNTLLYRTSSQDFNNPLSEIKLYPLSPPLGQVIPVTNKV